ncbi:MAG: SDR family NAD(P)-dependent oxidoreductase [Acidimicrobiales bacterium]
MQDFDGRVAVITGGASGIGLALAHRLAAEGMTLVLADIEAPALDDAAAGLRDGGATVSTMVCDVADADQVGALADHAWSEHGGVHFLANNAGVVTRHEPWGSLEDWKWVIDIDLWGVIHGVHHFVPRMLADGAPGHIMNTASTAGLLAFPGIASYNVAKRGVVALSETMHHELVDTELSVSVLCPGVVATRIGDSERNRPGVAPRPMAGSVGSGVGEELTAEAVADEVVGAVRAGRFYILPHAHYGEQALRQAENRTTGGPPVKPVINR